MKQHRQRNGQEGIAMIIVVCIMAVLVMMSLALLLASSVMTQNAGRVKDQEQSRILTVSLADELEKELTVTPSQQEKTQASGTILEFVNSKIISGSWSSGEEQTFSLDSSALNQTNELSAQATLSWEEGENGYTDASLYIRCTAYIITCHFLLLQSIMLILLMQRMMRIKMRMCRILFIGSAQREGR